MTNKLNHQFQKRVYSQQSHTPTEQILPTSGLVHAARSTNSGGATGVPRTIPLDVSTDISRDKARQPAKPIGEWLNHPTHKERKSLLTHIPSGAQIAPRTNTAVNLQTSGEPHGRGVRIDPDSAHSPQKLAERPLGGVRQDKDRNSCDRAASRQPAALNKFTRSQATSRKSARSQKESSDNRRCVPVQVWVSPLVKEELTRIAASESLSLSAAGGALLERVLQQHVDMHYGALLKPVIEKAFARQMGTLVTRLTWLLVRIAFDAGQTRSLVTNILGRQPGVTQPMLKTILESSGRSAKANIMRRTPQISELIESVEQWMVEDDRGVTEKYV
jgi:hypothetical protein